MLNETLIRRVVDQIRTDPHAWDQDSFQAEACCGTTRCFAGWAVALHYGVDDIYDGRFREKAFAALSVEHIPGDTAALARAALGLTEGQADELFYSYDGDVRDYVDRVERVTGLQLTSDGAAAR